MKKTLLLFGVVLVCGSVSLGAEVLKSGQLSNVTRLTNDTGIKYENPQWSPDGSQIAFTNLGYDNLYVMNADGANKRLVNDGLGVGYMFQWSADATDILVRDTRWEKNDEGELVRNHALLCVNMDGTAVRVTLDDPDMKPGAFKYDGNGKRRVVCPGAQVIENAAEAKARVRANKDNALTLSKAFEVSFITDCENLYRVDADGVKTQILEGEAFAPVLSPDGTKVAFVNMYDEIYVMNIDGTNKQMVAKGFTPSWVGNGQLVYERTTDDGHFYTSGELYITTLATRTEKQLTSTPGHIEMNASVSPDGNRVVFTDFVDGQVYVADLK